MCQDTRVHTIFLFPLGNHMKYTSKCSENYEANLVVTISLSAWGNSKICFRESKGLLSLDRAVTGMEIWHEIVKSSAEVSALICIMLICINRSLINIPQHHYLVLKEVMLA